MTDVASWAVDVIYLAVWMGFVLFLANFVFRVSTYIYENNRYKEHYENRLISRLEEIEKRLEKED